MKLSLRIEEICREISNGESIADIGTDHGYVPIILIKDKRISKCIMGDISADSLKKAKNNFELHDIDTERCDFRIGDGLDILKPYEVDTIIIGGLGGKTIKKILEKDIEKTETYQKLILQPRNNIGILRWWLNKEGYENHINKLVPEGNFICDILVAKKNFRLEKKIFKPDDIEWEFPENILNNDSNIVKKKIEYKLNKLNIRKDNLLRSNENQVTKIKKIEYDKKYLNSLLDKMNCIK